jgi:DNA polymerase-3 subunit delta
VAGVILKGAEALRYCARPDPGKAGLLLAGADAMRVALKRQEAVAALIGPEGEAEMRLDRIAAADLRKAPAVLGDALKAVGFFPGPRVVLLEDATDGLAEAIGAALADRRPGDPVLVVTAGDLRGKSALKTLFEQRPDCVAITFYDEPMTRAEIDAELARAGLARIDPAALEELLGLAQGLDPGDFRQTLERVALYKLGDPAPLTAAEVAALAPATIEGEMDALLSATTDGRLSDLGPALQRLGGQGSAAVSICIAALRHFRTLHGAAADPAGPAAALDRQRMPPRLKAAMQRQARFWGLRRIETALGLLVETDLTLRSTSKAPAMAVMERALIRLAMIARAAKGG